MCGIVGYIGPRDAAPILLEGLARLEYRGYDSAGIALVTASGELFVEKRAGKLVQPAHGAARRHARGGGRPRPHPLGDPRPAERPQRPSPRRLHRRRHGHPQRHHRELPGPPGRPRWRAATPSAPRPTPRCSRTSSRRPTRATSPMPCGPPCARPEGAYAVAVLHRGEPDRLVGARHDVPLIVGLGEGENMLASDVAAVLAPHPPGHLPRGGGRGRPAPRARSGSPASTASCGSARCTSSTGPSSPPRRAATSTSWPRRCTSSRWPSRSAIAGRLHEDGSASRSWSR